MKCRSYLPSVVLTTFITLTMAMSSLKTSENSENKDEFNKSFSTALYNKVQNILEENKGLLNSSKDENITVFIGNTGSGKSTLINFLSGKELSVDPNGDVVLKNPEDINSMKIGTGNQSETFLPKFIKLTDMTFFDVPGIGDTRGIEISLMNASFIKHIIEGAKSVRLVYVAGMDEITGARGKNFKELTEVIDNIVSNQNVQDCSTLVITKSQPRDKTKVKDRLLSKTEAGILDRWFDGNKFARFSAPNDDEIFMLEKEDIFLTILRSQPQRIEAINTSVLFGDKELGTLETIYTQEILNLVEKLIQSKSNFINVDMKVLNEQKQYFRDNFLDNLLLSIDNSLLIKLLKPIAPEIYQTTYGKIADQINLKREKVLGEINVEIKDQEKKIAEEEKEKAQAQAAAAQKAVEKAQAEKAAAQKAAEKAQAEKAAAQKAAEKAQAEKAAAQKAAEKAQAEKATAEKAAEKAQAEKATAEKAAAQAQQNAQHKKKRRWYKI